MNKVEKGEFSIIDPNMIRFNIYLTRGRRYGNARIGTCYNPLIKYQFEMLFYRLPLSIIRPTEVELLIGDLNKSKTKSDWVPKYDFVDLVKEEM